MIYYDGDKKYLCPAGIGLNIHTKITTYTRRREVQKIINTLGCLFRSAKYSMVSNKCTIHDLAYGEKKILKFDRNST